MFKREVNLNLHSGYVDFVIADLVIQRDVGAIGAVHLWRRRNVLVEEIVNDALVVAYGQDVALAGVDVVQDAAPIGPLVTLFFRDLLEPMIATAMPKTNW